MNIPNPFNSDNPFGESLNLIHFILITLIAILYFHHTLFFIISIFIKNKKFKETKNFHKYAVIICARNEEKVIGNLIDSIKSQDYPTNLVKTFVFADNCTDETAKIARDHGAIVYERFNNKLIGKSYVLDEAFKWIFKNYDNEFDAFLLFDADNILDKNFIREMNKAYDSGHKICTSFRNSKNYGKNWLASGSAMLFFRECVTMHPVRNLFKSSCYISGTGCLIDYNIIKEKNGWDYNYLIEDIQFSIDNICKGNKITYVSAAEFYDEQPIKFKDAWNQRMRWCKGNHQCYFGYHKKLRKRFFKTFDFSCIDLYTHTFPAPFLLTIWVFLLPIIYGIYALISDVPLDIYYIAGVKPLIDTLVFGFIYSAIVAFVVTIKIWKKLKTSTFKKILGIFAFPFYMSAYLPITVLAMFKKVKWVPISHTDESSIETIKQ